MVSYCFPAFKDGVVVGAFFMVFVYFFVSVWWEDVVRGSVEEG